MGYITKFDGQFEFNRLLTKKRKTSNANSL